ncbi:MAG TPA: 30S ribosome-binding factor RbfA [Microthrixaceae bacterium]|nr:30S ribosome-binding factor RbfA [Microthrixaceae bacterium]
MARRRPSPKRQFNRTDRIGELIREMVASELERLGDERLEMVTVTAVTVDGSLEAAKVYYSAMSAEDEGRDEEVVEALEDVRWRVQKLINREMSTRKTPQISFEQDTVLSSALRIEEILREVAVSEEAARVAGSSNEDDSVFGETGSAGSDTDEPSGEGQ